MPSAPISEKKCPHCGKFLPVDTLVSGYAAYVAGGAYGPEFESIVLKIAGTIQQRRRKSPRRRPLSLKKCRYCGHIIPGYKEWRKHEQDCIERPCRFCDAKFVTKAQRIEHEEKHRRGEIPIPIRPPG